MLLFDIGGGDEGHIIMRQEICKSGSLSSPAEQLNIIKWWSSCSEIIRGGQCFAILGPAPSPKYCLKNSHKSFFEMLIFPKNLYLQKYYLKQLILSIPDWYGLWKLGPGVFVKKSCLKCYGSGRFCERGTILWEVNDV